MRSHIMQMNSAVMCISHVKQLDLLEGVLEAALDNFSG